MGQEVPELEFMRGRTIVVMGDSIDRGYEVDFSARRI